MKTKIFLLSALVVLAACNNKKDPKAELADLKKQQADINAKITALSVNPVHSEFLNELENAPTSLFRTNEKNCKC